MKKIERILSTAFILAATLGYSNLDSYDKKRRAHLAELTKEYNQTIQRPLHEVCKEDYLKFILEQAKSKTTNKLAKEQKARGYINYVFETSENIPYYITKDIVYKIIKKESTFDERAHNKKTGARGLMQLRSIAWEETGMENYLKNAFKGYENIEAGIKYLEKVENYCVRKHPEWNELSDEKKLKMVLAAYNGGPTNLRKRNWKIKNMKPETKKYVKVITQKI